MGRVWACVACVVCVVGVLCGGVRAQGLLPWEGLEGAYDDVVLTQMPHETTKVADLPKNFDWRNVNGVNYVTVARNQHAPDYCGACWAFATLSALEDRIKIMRKAAWPDVILSSQMLLNCATEAGDCKGGHPIKVLKYLHNFGVVDETCAPYEARRKACEPLNICKDCRKGEGCHPVDAPRRYFIEEYGTIHGEDHIRAEIYARGPVACGVAVPEALYDFKGTGVFDDPTGTHNIRHLVSLVGWGENENGKYWIVRNSWGTEWGHEGFGYIRRGDNTCALNNICWWAVPRADATDMTGDAHGASSASGGSGGSAGSEDTAPPAATATSTFADAAHHSSSSVSTQTPGAAATAAAASRVGAPVGVDSDDDEFADDGADDGDDDDDAA